MNFDAFSKTYILGIFSKIKTFSNTNFLNPRLESRGLSQLVTAIHDFFTNCQVKTA